MMVVFKDICFCANQDCKKRKKCARALENYSEETKKDKYFSMADFKCNDKIRRNMFIKF